MTVANHGVSKVVLSTEDESPMNSQSLEQVYICEVRTHAHTQIVTHTHTHTHTHTSSDLLAPKGVGQGPGSSLGPVTKADRLSNGWAGQAHARQPWGEWLPGTLAVKMAVRRARWTAR